MQSPASLIKLGLVLLFGSLVVFFLTSWRAGIPPRIDRFADSLSQDPLQTAIEPVPFDVARAGKRYTVTPKYDYTLSGLVVSQHDSSSWLDITHAKWGDFLNTKDICVIWGENLKDGAYTRLSFSSGNWTCYVQSSNSEDWQAFRPHQLSNNHVLPADHQIARQISDLEVGDEILIKGNLVDYQIDGSSPRRSSTIRTDTGNGACEIVWVKELVVLGHHNQFWVRLRGLSKLAMLAGLLAIVAGFGSSLWPSLGSRIFGRSYGDSND